VVTLHAAAGGAQSRRSNLCVRAQSPASLPLNLFCACIAPSVTPLQGTLDAFRRIPREEGFRGFYKGVGPSVQRAAIINGCGIASYDHTKQVRRDRLLLAAGLLLTAALLLLLLLLLQLCSLRISCTQPCFVPQPPSEASPGNRSTIAGADTPAWDRRGRRRQGTRVPRLRSRVSPRQHSL
jgi:hypothetical protein